MGAAYLVSRSQFKVESQANNLDESDVKMHTRIALLVDTLSRGQQYLLAKCLGDVEDHVIRKEIKRSRQSYQDVLTCPMEMRVPRSSNDMSKMFTKGKNAFLENLPHPPVVTENNHAYVRLGDCIADLLAHGTQVSFLFNRKDNKELYPNSCRVSLEQSANADEICEDVLSQDYDVNYPLLPLYCICWSDDCNPNGTNKNNCGSIWVKMVTISSLKSDCWCNTYVLSVDPKGDDPKGDDHSVVESSYNDEIKELSSPNSKHWFYYHLERKMVRFHVWTMVVLSDQPEQRGRLGLVAGNGTFAAQWGYTIRLAETWEKLLPCTTCSDLLCEGTRDGNLTKCVECVKWDMSNQNLHFQYSATKDYPPLSPDAISETSSCGILLGPEPITKLSLTAAIAVTQEKIFNKEWTSKQGAAYLQAKGVGTDAIQTTTKRATYIAMLNSTNIDNNDEVVGEMFELLHEDPTMFAIYKGPVTWDSDADINDNVDVVMHLLFLGIVKSAIEQTTKWLKKQMKYGLFVKTTDRLLEMVQHLNLDWCCVLGFQRGKLGGWVSENYLGFARLLLWFFSMIDTVAINEEYQEPLCDSQNWNKKETTSWLSARGLDKKGSAQELKERVQMYLQQTNIPLPCQSSGSVKGVVNVWKSLHSLLQIVMRTGEDEINTEEIDFLVKRFFSCYAKVD
ncbi:hypothetical protein ACA910_007523 [Epithemia clementina (nom. ined.)]